MSGPTSTCHDCGVEQPPRIMFLNVHDGLTRCRPCSDAWWLSDAARAVFARIDAAARKRAEFGIR